MSAIRIIASTIGWDYSDVSESEYQPGHWTPRRFTIGDRYFAVSKKSPGEQWKKHPDQFWAEDSGTVLWIFSPESSQGLGE